MRRLKPINSKMRAPRKLIREPREISVDDVIKELINLFESLGIDAERLAARTAGLKRKEIDTSKLYPHIAAIGELLTFWHQDPNYLDESGNPFPIRLNSSGCSFKSLSQRAVPGLDPKRVLTDLENIGAVHVSKSGVITARMRSLSVYENRRMSVQHTLTSLSGFVRTLKHNLDSAPSNAEQLFHRIAHSGEFDCRDIPALKIRVRRHAQDFLESCDNWMKRRSKSLDGVAPSSKLKRAQVSIGVYLSVDEIS